MIMDKKERLHRTNKIIKKRWGNLMSWMLFKGLKTKKEAQSSQILTPHHLHKYNLDCGCHLCKTNKYYGKYRNNKKKEKEKMGD